jgi:hyaluronoglucosaminidase
MSRQEPKTGIMEIFFGPPWTDAQRLAYAPFLARHGFDFYIYGPKADGNLRKNWSESWPAGYEAGLRRLSATFRENDIRFGLALSPYGTQESFNSSARDKLREKVSRLESVGLDIFGLFFDDMPGSDGLAERQLAVLETVRGETGASVLFCPSYYSPDPILDKVFGQRPEGYLEEIGRSLPAEVEILWTGPKVISPEIPLDHVKEVTELLRRRPFLCENFFANDGPKNCKFLKLRAFTGRAPEAMAEFSGVAFNPMNQPEASKIVLLSAMQVMREGADPQLALRENIAALSPPELAKLLQEQRQLFLETGIDGMDEGLKADFRKRLSGLNSPLAAELSAWLAGEYTVGSECLTD